jgi:chromosome segregation ATPase
VTPALERRVSELEAEAFRRSRRQEAVDEAIAGLTNTVGELLQQGRDLRADLAETKTELARAQQTLSANLKRNGPALEQIMAALGVVAPTQAEVDAALDLDQR